MKRKAEAIMPGTEQPESAAAEAAECLASEVETFAAAASREPYEVVASVLSDVGRRHAVNEDCGRHIQPADPGLLTSKGWLTIVADGMGGHAAGNVASHLAVEVISRAYYAETAAAPDALRRAFQEANREIYRASLIHERLRGMGTTCTALVLQAGSALCAHVGDSRLYLVRDGEIYQMSEDHSVVMDLVKHGVISAADARRHRDRNLILRALGTRPVVEASVWPKPFPVRARDQFILCSDGLSDLVEDEEIKQAVSSKEPHPACASLIALAKARGGHDDITVGVVSLKPQPLINSAGAVGRG
jgi:protein phosphatase